MDVTTALFFLFSAVLLFAAFRVITARNPVYAALYLVLTFFQASAIWLMLSAEFLAITLVLVYVGAVMVLFLFVVMMLDINVDTLRQGFWKHFPLAAGFGVLIALEMSAVLLGGFRATEIASAATTQVAAAHTTASASASTSVTAVALTTASEAASSATATASEPASVASTVASVSSVSVASNNTASVATVASSATVSNTRALGILLYTEYLYPLEIAAVILLVAIISAIALTLRGRKDSRYVNPAHQVRVKAKDRLSVVQVSSTLPASMRPAPAAETVTEEAKS